VFENYDKVPRSGTVTNVGLSIEVTVQPGKPKQQPRVMF
jgi:hypothetical protein